MRDKIDISKFINKRTEQTIKFDLKERFKQRRKEYGLSQKELSTRSGISYASIRRFETSGEISLSSLIRLCFVMDIATDFDELFSETIVRSIRP